MLINQIVSFASIIALTAIIKVTDINKENTELCTIKNNLHSDLYHISFMESSSGKNKKHRLVNYGLNYGHRAAGNTGLMPLTIKETIDKNPGLKHKYGLISSLSPDKVTLFINNNEEVENEIANAHWFRLTKLFPNNERKRVYAWKNGISSAIKASDYAVKNHPYVKKFIKLKYRK